MMLLCRITVAFAVTVTTTVSQSQPQCRSHSHSQSVARSDGSRHSYSHSRTHSHVAVSVAVAVTSTLTVALRFALTFSHVTAIVTFAQSHRLHQNQMTGTQNIGRQTQIMKRHTRIHLLRRLRRCFELLQAPQLFFFFENE